MSTWKKPNTAGMGGQEALKVMRVWLDRAKDGYYNEGDYPSDVLYDTVFDECEALEKSLGVSCVDSPTQRVGYSVGVSHKSVNKATEPVPLGGEIVSKLQKVRHTQRCLSLEKTKSLDELVAFLGVCQGLLSWKMDGVTTILTYVNGDLISGVTRGNGEIGENITHNVRQYVNVPRTISHKGKLVLRGESIITYTDFENINERAGGVYKNPRNLVSGTVRQLNSAYCAQRSVRFYAFECIEGLEHLTTKSSVIQALDALGFTTVDCSIVRPDNLIDIVRKYESQVSQYQVPTDGLVLTYDSIEYSNSRGETSRSPKHSLAFKWKDELAQTVLRDVVWQVSRTGSLTPVAVFDTVDIEGSEVSRASLHNMDIIRGLELGIGDTITVYKANMIIPQVADNLTRSNDCEPPVLCPSCRGIVVSKIEDKTEVFYCSNPNCDARIVDSIVHYCSRDAMNIDGMGDGIVSKLVSVGLLEDFESLYHLKEHRAEFISLEGFGPVLFDKLISNIEKSRLNVPLARFIYALGLDNVGKTTARDVSKHFGGNVNAFYSATSFLGIPGIGVETERSLLEFLDRSNSASPNSDRCLCVLPGYLDFESVSKPVIRDSLITGKVFCITGDLENYKNRDALVAEIESFGGRFASSVSKNTHYLITNDTSSGSNKNKKARELGVKVISEAEYRRMVGL